MGRRYLDSPRLSDAAARQRAEDDVVPAAARVARTVESDEEQARRREMLLKWTFRLSPEAVEAVRETVIALTIRHRFRSEESDRSLYKQTMPYAVWCHQHLGRFDPDIDLVDHVLVDRIPKVWPQHAESSRATRMAGLRRLRRGPQPAAGRRRRPQKAFDQRGLQDLYRGAENAGKYKNAAHVLLGLSAGAGLNSAEIVRARGDWFSEEHGLPCLYVPNEDGEFRVVPLEARTAARLRPLAKERPDERLFRPTARAYSSLISDTNLLILRQTELWRPFTVPRARHTWISRLLSMSIPFTPVCAMAGIKPGNSLPSDLVGDLDTPSTEDVFKAFKAAHRHTGALR